MTEQPKPNPVIYLFAFACQLFMAFMLAGVVGHIGEVTVVRAMISAAFLWAGFVMTTMMINHRFQSAKWSLTVIDGAHWLGVLLIMGFVLGLMGS